MRSVLVAIALVAACGASSNVDREVGARCRSVDECEDRCLGPGGDYPDGFCSIDCSISSDCPRDTECVDREGGVCLFACLDDVDCEFLGEGWTCHDDPLRADPDTTVGVCRG